MKEDNDMLEISDEDIKAAFKEINAYIDISIEDFKEIYLHALRHARYRLLNISVDNVMTKKIISVTEEANINEAIHLFSENKIPCLPVVDDKGGIKGIVTRKDIIVATGVTRDHTLRDIIRHMIGVPTPHHHTVNDKTVKDIMSSPVITIKSGSDVKEAAFKLIEMRINNLPVVDKDNKLLGVISAGDIVKNAGGMKL
ncbi:MAG: CBS domain-containing protein [bacterium]